MEDDRSFCVRIEAGQQEKAVTVRKARTVICAGTFGALRVSKMGGGHCTPGS